MVRIGRRSWKELEDTVAAAVDSSGCDLVAVLSRIHLQHTVRVKMPRTATGAVQATRHGWRVRVMLPTPPRAHARQTAST